MTGLCWSGCDVLSVKRKLSSLHAAAIVLKWSILCMMGEVGARGIWAGRSVSGRVEHGNRRREFIKSMIEILLVISGILCVN